MSEVLHCVNHPNAETRLRCNKCGQPMCPRCMVRTPVGYRCRDCVSSQQRVFYAEFRPVHYVVAAAVALPLALVTGWLIPSLGSWLYTIVLGALAGGGIAEVVRWAIRRRRGKYTWLVVCGCIVVGALPGLLGSFLPVALTGYLWGGMDVLWSGIYLVASLGAAYTLLRPGRRI